VDVEQLKAIVAALSETDITRFDYRNEHERLIIRRGPEGLQAVMQPMGQLHPMHLPPMHLPPMHYSAAPAAHASAPAPASATTAAPAAAPKVEEQKGVVIASPFVGTFYRAPSPDAPTFAEIGQMVKKGQTLCIVEAMKLMNEIEAEVGGKVVEVYVQNGQSVEFGEKLFRIEPA